jgi:hypothetical protein
MPRSRKVRSGSGAGRPGHASRTPKNGKNSKRFSLFQKPDAGINALQVSGHARSTAKRLRSASEQCSRAPS